MASRTLDRQPLIAYDLHDGVAQYLASALMHLENYERCRAPQREDAANAFREGVELIKRSIHELRSLIRGLHQATIEANLVDAFQGLIEDYQSMSQIEFIHDLPPLQLDPWLTSTLFRIAQESLTNACRHSRSEKIRVELIQHDGQLRLAVKDWGVGFDTKAVYGTKFGLCGIRERARMLAQKSRSIVPLSRELVSPFRSRWIFGGSLVEMPALVLGTFSSVETSPICRDAVRRRDLLHRRNAFCTIFLWGASKGGWHKSAIRQLLPEPNFEHSAADG